MIPILSDLFPALVGVAARGALLLAAGLLIRRMVPAGRTGARHAAVTAILVGLLVLPPLTAAAPWRVRVLPEGSSRIGDLGATAPGAEVERPIRRSPPRGPEGLRRKEGVAGAPGSASTEEPASTSGHRAATAVEPVEYLRAGVVLVWAVGVLVLLGRLVLGLFLLARHRRRARRLAGPPWSDRLDEAEERVGIQAPVRLYRGSAFPVPVVWGAWRPVVLLSEDSARWSDARARAVLLHELSHIRRRDWLWMLLGRIARDLHWLDPLAWWAWRRMCGDAETACDLGAVRAGVSRAVYARHLVQIARSGRQEREPAPALPLATTTDVERRVLHVLEAPLGGRRGLACTAVAAAVAVGVLVAALAPRARAAPPESRTSVHFSQASADSVGPDEVVEALVAALSDPSSPVRRSAVNALRNLGAVDSRRDALEPLLSDSVEDVRVAAAVVLGLREPRPNLIFPPGRVVEPDPARVRALVEELGDRDFRVRLRAVNGLSDLRARSAAEALADRLSDPDFRVRQAAANALGNVGASGAVEALLARLSDPDFRVRQAAANALGEIGDSRAVPSLRRAFDDESAHVRQAVAGSLGDIGARSAAPVLIAALEDPDEHVRRVAAESLGELGDGAAGEGGEEAAGELGGEAIGPVGRASAGVVREPGRKAEGTRRSGPDEPPVCSPPTDVAGAGPGSDLPAEVRTLLEDGDGDRRERAAWRIGLLASPVGRSGADLPEVEAVGKRAPKSFHHALIAALYDPDDEVRLAAICSLGRVGRTAALEHLARRAEDRDPGMVAAVEWTRARIRARRAGARP